MTNVLDAPTTIKVLLSGSNGQIGWELARALPAQWQTIAVGRAQMDLADPRSIRSAVRDLRPDLIINAAGYTAVDRAESEPQLADAVNAEAVGVIGEEARRIGAAVVHFSTDYVFDGAKGSPYTPQDAPNPLSVYGKTKRDGELALANSGAAHVIFRTSWVYGARGSNFLLAMLRQAQRGNSLRVVNDQTGSPNWCRPLAQATARILESSITGEPGHRSFGGREGVYHLSSSDQTTWYGFAAKIFELARLPQQPEIEPITSQEYGAAAKRPAFSVLDCRMTRDAFGVQMDDWETMLRRMLADSTALGQCPAGEPT